MAEMTLEEIRTALRSRRVSVVARATEIHRNTIGRIASGRTRNPSWDTVRRLSDYLADDTITSATGRARQ